MASPIDTAIKRKYQLAFLRRNYLLKVHAAIKWGLTEEEWKLMDEAWGIKAKNMGKQAEEFLEMARKEAKSRFAGSRFKRGYGWGSQTEIDKELARVGGRA